MRTNVRRSSTVRETKARGLETDGNSSARVHHPKVGACRGEHCSGKSGQSRRREGQEFEENMQHKPVDAPLIGRLLFSLHEWRQGGVRMQTGW